jgi:hypothetical protein
MVSRKSIFFLSLSFNAFCRTDSLPSFKQNLGLVKVKNPIEQHMVGRAGLFRQQNVEKRRTMSVREWAELCSQDDYRAPSVDGVGPYHARHITHKARRAKPKSQAREIAGGDDSVTPPLEDSAKQNPDDNISASIMTAPDAELDVIATDQEKPKVKGRKAQTREAKEATLAERAAQDAAFLEEVDLARHWLPPNTDASDYTPEFCKELERQYWRNCGLSKPAWYGADMQGMGLTSSTLFLLFTIHFRYSFWRHGDLLERWSPPICFISSSSRVR